MIPRYTLPEMGAIWSDQARFEAMLRVELAVARARPRAAGPARCAGGDRDARPRRRRADRRARADDRPRRDRLRQPGRRDGRARRALPPLRPDQQRRGRHGAGAPVPRRRRAAAAPTLDRLLAVLVARARAHADDRDDGPHPFGPRRADHVRAQARRLGVRAGPRPAPAGGRRRRDRRRARSPGRSAPTAISARRSRRRCSAALGLHVDPVSTQIVQRDRHAAFLTAIAVVGGSLERFATEIRNLQHTEIGEVQEPFGGPEGLVGDAPQAQPDHVRADRRPGAAAARLRPRGARGPGAVARARHQPFVRRARDPARTRRRCSTTCWSGSGLVEGLVVRPERMRENIERGLGLHASSTCSWRSSRRRAVAARTRTRSSSAPRCGRPTSARRCGTAGRRSGGRPAPVARPARRLLRRRDVPAPRA